MHLKLMSSDDGPALAIRDHLLPLVRKNGTLGVQRGAVRLITLDRGIFRIEHWTPFNELSPEEASSPGYRSALDRQRSQVGLPYGVEVWHEGIKVLSVLWADDGEFTVREFRRGSWEADALAL